MALFRERLRQLQIKRGTCYIGYSIYIIVDLTWAQSNNRSLLCKSLTFLSQANMTKIFQNLRTDKRFFPLAAILGYFKMAATVNSIIKAYKKILVKNTNFLNINHRITCNTSFPGYLRSRMTSFSIKS